KGPLLEVLQALKDAPDAVRDRFVAWQKAKAEAPKPAEAQFALAMSGYVVGADAAVDDLATAQTLWAMRDQVHGYLASRDEPTRPGLLKKLEEVSPPAETGQPIGLKKLDTVTRLALNMPPPLHDDESVKSANGPRTYRVRDDDNAQPTEYT